MGRLVTHRYVRCQGAGVKTHVKALLDISANSSKDSQLTQTAGDQEKKTSPNSKVVEKSQINTCILIWTLVCSSNFIYYIFIVFDSTFQSQSTPIGY